jgi:hypothetical protein
VSYELAGRRFHFTERVGSGGSRSAAEAVTLEVQDDEPADIRLVLDYENLRPSPIDDRP